MTSVLKRVDNAVEAYIGTFVDGSVQGGQDVTNDLSTEGVGLSYSGGFIDDIKSTIEEYTRRSPAVRSRCRRPEQLIDAHSGTTTAGPGG